MPAEPVWDEAAIEAVRLAGRIVELEALVERLVRVGTQEIKHRFKGACPDQTQPASRDPLCSACKALVEARLGLIPTEGGDDTR